MVRNIYNRLRSIRIPYKITFFIMGIVSTVWFLIRVIPKPSRAGYPCMKAAAPFMSSFVIYLLSVSGSAMLFKRSGRFFKKARYVLAAGAFLGALVLFAFSSNIFPEKLFAATEDFDYADPSDYPPNQPMGEGLGIFPGRVVWEWDPDATNENCTNQYNSGTDADAYFMAKNNDQDVINRMMDDVLMKLCGSYTVAGAWDMLFRDFNDRKGNGDIGYVEGQTLFIKMNFGGAGWLTESSDLSHKTANWAKNNYPNAETSAPMAIALLDQLINDYGIPQEYIYAGDPNAHILKDNYDQMVALFPDVKYMDKDHSDLGRTLITRSAEPAISWSDPSTINDPKETTYLWEEVENADYLINLSDLKAHARAGITLTAKNHFGTHANSEGAAPLHPGLICAENYDIDNARNQYGMYRVLTDIMGHEKLGGNTVLFIVEGLWGGPEAVSIPEKWQSAPFNNDWPSSILASQDAVALESVCFDLLRNEYNNFDDVTYATPWYGAVDDHLHQAADSDNWPEGIIYDPEGDGTPMSSMGIHEHWNNSVDRQYSRNLGYNYGIELIAPKLLVENTINALEAEALPLIDGEALDACWNQAQWYHIDQTWINWGEEIDSSDFFGRFKVSWSEAENLVYYFVEITDDAFVDGYVYDDGGYPNFDIVEVFLDEDASGGLHVFDNNATWGQNSENAFSYHIAVDAPADGSAVSTFHACDIDGENWPAVIMDYADHIPELTMRKSGNKYYYEFSLKVFNDTYDHSNPEASRVKLEADKLMGMSMAYCDNDTPGTDRDNFFGSVWVPEEAYNDHWMNADGFGSVRLINSGTVMNHAVEVTGSIANYRLSELNTDLVVEDNLLEVFNDPDGDILSYSVNCDESKLNFTIEGNVLKVNASAEFAGEPEVTVTALDGSSSASTSFKISFGTTLAVEVIGSISDYELTRLNSFQIVQDDLRDVFSDPNETGLTYTATSDQAALDFSIVMNVLKVKASAAFDGEADVSVLASDGITEASTTFKITAVIAGISGRGAAEGINCYPNPVSDHLNVELQLESSYTGKASVQLFNMAGMSLISHNANLIGGEGFVGIDLGGQTSGYYILRIDAGAETYSFPIHKR